MGVTITDKSDAFLRRIDEAVDGPGGALAATVEFFASKSKESMPQGGSFGIRNDTPTANQPASPPGTPPSPKDGNLRNSITFAKVGKYRWAFGTNSKYGRIHELGGVINHPGGTAYIMIDGQFQPVRNENAKPWMRRTKPHPINMPPRPYLRPALFNNKKQGQAVFNARMRQKMGGGA